MIRITRPQSSNVPERKYGNVVCEKRLSVRKRVSPMRYEGGRPEPNPTVREIYGAWALVGAILLALVLVDFA